MNILVTGATGFIGNYVMQELLKTNHDITATAVEDPDSLKGLKWKNQVRYTPYDMSKDSGNLFKLFNNPDLLIHLAWEGLPNYKNLIHLEKNVMNSYWFIKKLLDGGIKSVSVIGTCFEYGLQNGCLFEDAELRPVTAYGLAKNILRCYIDELNKSHNIHFKWIRLFYLYGTGQGKNSLLEQLKKAIATGEKVFNMSGGEQLRDYLPVEKVAEYVVKIALQDQYDGIFNCCSGIPISIRRLVEEYLREHGQKMKLNLGYYPYPDFEPMAFWGDNSRLTKVLELYKQRRFINGQS